MPSMEYFLEHEDAIKSQCKVTKGTSEDSVFVKVKKDGYVLYIDIIYYYEYYHQTASYYEPEEESYTLKSIKSWEITDVERDAEDFRLDNEEEIIKKYDDILTEDELIEAVLKETTLQY